MKIHTFSKIIIRFSNRRNIYNLKSIFIFTVCVFETKFNKLLTGLLWIYKKLYKRSYFLFNLEISTEVKDYFMDQNRFYWWNHLSNIYIKVSGIRNHSIFKTQQKIISKEHMACIKFNTKYTDLFNRIKSRIFTKYLRRHDRYTGSIFIYK